MRLSPALCLLGLVVVFITTIIGVGQMHGDIQNVMAVLGFGGTITVGLLNILKQDYAIKKQEDAAKEVKQTVAAVNAVRDDKLNVLAETVQDVKGKVEVVVKQTNGDLTKKLEVIHEEVKAGLNQNAAIIKAVGQVNKPV